MKHKYLIITIMWILYGTLEEYIPLLSNDIVSWIPIIITLCLIFDVYPKSLFSKTYKLEKKIMKKIQDISTLDLNEHIYIEKQGNDFNDIYVYYNNEKICSLKEFEDKYPGKYEHLLEKIHNTSIQIIEPVYEEIKDKPNAIFSEIIDQIDSYNIDIPDEEISLGLYNCSNQLKYLQKLLLEYPQDNEKIKKLDQYYLPILLDILSNYCKVSKTSHADSIKNKLNQTLVLVNEAIKNITQSLFDDEKLNLNVDMDVLEKLLKKDGLVMEKRYEQTK